MFQARGQQLQPVQPPFKGFDPAGEFCGIHRASASLLTTD